MRLGIVGNGTVGNAMSKAFAEHVEEVRVYDIRPERSTNKIDEVLSCDLVMLCLPTPELPDSHACDTTALEVFFTYAVNAGFRDANYVIRSTVPVGFTRQMRERFGLTNLVHSPEFLTARTAEEDARNPTRTVIGAEWIMDEPRADGVLTCSQLLSELYWKVFPRVPFFRMTSDSSEFLKLLQNSFSAVKIAFLNEAHVYASKLRLNWNFIVEALLAGGWVNPAHTQVPGPDGKYGFGGACLEKDTANFASCMSEAGLPPMMCVAALTRNRCDRARVK